MGQRGFIGKVRKRGGVQKGKGKSGPAASETRRR